MSFHVPNQYRLHGASAYGSDDSYGNNGAFIIPYSSSVTLCTIASDQEGWDHVSVSLQISRCPVWQEMCFIKHLFWDAEDTVMQLHPPESQYVNCHPYTLHLWRPNDGREIPLPPRILV